MLHPSGNEQSGPYATPVDWNRVPKSELDICNGENCGAIEWIGNMDACECGSKACGDCMKVVDELKQCPVCRMAEAEDMPSVATSGASANRGPGENQAEGSPITEVCIDCRGRLHEVPLASNVTCVCACHGGR